MSCAYERVTAARRLDCIDLTPAAERFVLEREIVEGLFIAFCTHTTCSLLVNEWEEGAHEDFARTVGELFPPGAYYVHDDLTRRTQNLVPDERENGHAHLAQMVVGGTTQLIPISSGRLTLGEWQRLFLVEFDEPKERTIVFQALDQSSTQSFVTNSQNASPA